MTGGMKMEENKTLEALRKVVGGLDTKKEAFFALYMKNGEEGLHIISSGKAQIIGSMIAMAIESDMNDDERLLLKGIAVADIMSDGKLVELLKAIERENAHLCIKDDK